MRLFANLSVPYRINGAFVLYRDKFAGRFLNRSLDKRDLPNNFKDTEKRDLEGETMGLHERAWAGISILVFGKSETIPMQIEQAIAEASPGNEIKVESFEDYSDALDHCKNKRDVGFIFLLENCGEMPTQSVFRELSKPYESNGWPCFGTLLFEKTETISGLRALQDCPNLLSYQSYSDVLDSKKTAESLNDLWIKFSAAFEKRIAPIALQETLISIATERVSLESIHFSDRVSTLLSGNLNVSWIETVALRWSPVLSYVREINESALKPHIALGEICNLARYNGDRSSVVAIASAKQSLVSRISATVEFLNDKREKGVLVEELKLLGTLAKPGAPALLRHTVALRDRINQIATEESGNSLKRTG